MACDCDVCTVRACGRPINDIVNREKRGHLSATANRHSHRLQIIIIIYTTSVAGLFIIFNFAFILQYNYKRQWPVARTDSIVLLLMVRACILHTLLSHFIHFVINALSYQFTHRRQSVQVRTIRLLGSNCYNLCIQ